MRNPIAVLKSLEEKAKQKGYVFERLYRNLYNPEFYLLAYQNIAKSQGSMTEGTDGMTLDDMTVGRIERIIASLKDRSYQPNPARREYIPKKSNPSKTRPLGIPSTDDKLVQEVVRMLLEAIYEPTFSTYLDYVADHISVEQSVCYQVYVGGSAQVRDYISANAAYYDYNYDRGPILRYSDYAALRSIAGYPPVELEPGKYLIHCMVYLNETLQRYDQPITVAGARLDPGGVYTEHLSQSSWTVNGRGYILVVPDEAAEGLPVHHRAYAAKTAQPVTEAQFYDLYKINADENRANPMASDTIHSRAEEEDEVAYHTALAVFPLYYLALALTMTAATILTIQQLSETDRYRRQFELLRKLGMDRRDTAKALRTQFAVYYVMPAVPAVMIGVPFILNLANLPEPGVLSMANSPAAIACIALGLFFLIYAVYILLAYTSLKRNVLPE